MPVLVSAALSTSPTPYAAVMAVGFVLGVVGHIVRSRTLILVGILIVGVAAVTFAFGVGKLS